MPNLHKIIKAGMEKMTREMLLTITNGYEKKYIEKYGEYMPRHTGFMLDEEEREATYKKALETGKTWREITGYPEKGGI